MTEPWDRIEAEARGAFVGAGRFPLPAYSESMPPPYVGIKPYAPERARMACTFGCSHGGALDIDEYEQAHDLEPGLDRIALHLVHELGRLVRGEGHALSRPMLAGNPAWPDELAAAAAAGTLAHDPIIVIAALALSRSQDDKGNDRWTLFGASHDGPARPVWQGLDEARLAQLLGWAGITGDWRIIADAAGLPAALRRRVVAGGASLDGVRAIVTFEPFARLPAPVRAAYLGGELVLVPTPASLIVFEHPRYRALAATLPRAQQIALLHLFPRVEQSCAIRIPQSGWLDEADPDGATAHGHRVVPEIVRTHRWQRIARDADPLHHEATYADKVSVALFSTDPVAVDLYDKPLARNSQVWDADYDLVLDGQRATRDQIAAAARRVDAGGRFGYRMYYPPMRAGVRELFWHVPVVAAAGRGRAPDLLAGYISAELDGAEPIVLEPHLLARPAHVAAARGFARDPGRPRYTTAHNVRKLLDASALLGGPIARDHARALLHIAKRGALDAWLDELAAEASDRSAATALVGVLRAGLAAPTVETPAAPDVPLPIVLDQLGTRAFEDQVWSTIAHLAHGEFRQKSNADGITVNRGKDGGKAARAAHVVVHDRRDLEALGDHLHARYRALIAAAGMTGRAEVVDHVFAWDTDFAFPWMGGWDKNRRGPAERNVVCVIPGNNRREAVVMGDHYDTAYMEDVYYKESGGDLLRAPAAGADDNHSATTALLLAAERLLPLAAAGRLERDVWLVHLTGEEYPSDCMGARALCQALVERRLAFTAEDGAMRDVSQVDVVAAYVLDMIGHNADRDRDVFQIAPGEGAASARLARRAHHANLAWNRLAVEWNRAPDRHGKGRAHRMPDSPSHSAPPPFAHLPLHGEIRVEWEPRSALYNTDGQIFSDVGIPVVLFMENYDISRKGYHDTHDTMANIDLDYCAALTAIAIETVAATACAAEP